MDDKKALRIQTRSHILLLKRNHKKKERLIWGAGETLARYISNLKYIVYEIMGYNLHNDSL